MGEEKELILPARTIERPPLVEGPAPQPTVIGHASTQRSEKIDPSQNTGISPSKVLVPERELVPNAGWDPVNRQFISEQEFIERRERQQDIEDHTREVESRSRRWAGKTPEEILILEVEIRRPGTLKDPTWSFYATKDGFQAHLWGVTEAVTPHQLDYCRRSKEWHVLARGILERLRRKRTRQLDIEQTPRPEVYEEQVGLLRELVLEAGGERWLEDVARATEGIREPATKAKTEVHQLVKFLGAFIREKARAEVEACRTDQKAAAAAGVAEPAGYRSADPEEVELLRAEVEYLQAQLAKVRAAMGLGEA